MLRHIIYGTYTYYIMNLFGEHVFSMSQATIWLSALGSLIHIYIFKCSWCIQRAKYDSNLILERHLDSKFASRAQSALLWQDFLFWYTKDRAIAELDPKKKRTLFGWLPHGPFLFLWNLTSKLAFVLLKLS